MLIHLLPKFQYQPNLFPVSKDQHLKYGTSRLETKIPTLLSEIYIETCLFKTIKMWIMNLFIIDNIECWMKLSIVLILLYILFNKMTWLSTLSILSSYIVSKKPTLNFGWINYDDILTWQTCRKQSNIILVHIYFNLSIEHHENINREVINNN